MFIKIFMADTGIFATTAEVQHKAGANASATSNVEAYINDFMTQAEATINVMTRYNWSDAYSGLNVDVKGILKEAASNLAAIYIIQFDMSGFTSRGEAEDMMTVLRDGFNRNIQLLQQIAQQDFTNGA
jgi:beta-galactosidase/beta-glucuronidase